MARRTVRLGRLVRAGTSSGLSSVQWSSAVRREDERLGRGLRVEGRVRPALLVRAGTSLAMSREQASRRSGKRPVTRRETRGPKDSEVGASRPGQEILWIEQRTVVQRGPAGGPATRTRSQSRRESKAGASSLGKNIPGNEQRTGFEAIRRMAGDSERDSWPEGQ
jgi:hypothetical protein